MQEEIAALAGAEQGLAVITTGSEKVQMARTVIALKVSGHDGEPRSALGWESVTDDLGAAWGPVQVDRSQVSQNQRDLGHPRK